MVVYDHKAIEQKWRQRWQGQRKPTDVAGAKKPYYCLDMFPYPSGSGLHVGHWRGYVLSDFYARLAQLKGFDVLHPIGFDSFGLPAENAAIKHKSHPKKFIQQAIESFTQQLDQMGALYDWSLAISTSQPEYYRWTQWLFLRLFEHGLAEKRLSLVNWCPNDQTVLANEQVISGCCDRCGSRVTKKELSQWFLKTTVFSQELLDGLEELDWPEHVKLLQKNWIGRSEGVEIDFLTEDEKKITVFTTRPDTIYGAVAIVLAPEHQMVNKVVKSELRDKFNLYLEKVRAKTNVERSQGKETANTAFFSGSNATHPLTGEKLPIWIADYVLSEYGSGAIMSVPAHDERDFLFARIHKLPIIQVVASSVENKLPFIEMGILINSADLNGLSSKDASSRITEQLLVQNKGRKKISYRLRDWLVSRQRYWGAPIPIVYDPDGKSHPVKEQHLPLLLPQDVDFIPSGESPIARSSEYQDRAEKLYGKGWRFETDTLDTFVDSSWYFLRYLNPNDHTQPFDKEKVKKWLPVNLYIGGIEHATLHLLYARFITRFLAKFGYIDQSITEPFKQLFNVGMINLHGDKMSKSKNNIISPDPLVEHYGTDALRGYELFIGPMDVDAEWNSRGINGVHKFLIKLLKLTSSIAINPNLEQQQLFNQYLSDITRMADEFKLNTYIAEAMKFTNTIEQQVVDREVLRRFAVTLWPVFPFVASEILEKLGHDKSDFSWPDTFEVSTATEVDLAILDNTRGKNKLVAVVKVEIADLSEKKYADLAHDYGIKSYSQVRLINQLDRQTLIFF